MRIDQPVNALTPVLCITIAIDIQSELISWSLVNVYAEEGEAKLVFIERFCGLLGHSIYMFMFEMRACSVLSLIGRVSTFNSGVSH